MQKSAKPWIIGNWKMNLSPIEARQTLLALEAWQKENTSVRLSVAAPTLYATDLCLRSNTVDIFLQNCHWAEKGAYTGEISPVMMAHTGVRGSLVGHSERRVLFHETDTAAGKKTYALRSRGLHAILCVGETFEERQKNTWKGKLHQQIAHAFHQMPSFPVNELIGSDNTQPKFAIAYEPVWAIGTGLSATPQQANEAHEYLYEELKSLFPDGYNRVPLLYGGSVTEENALELLSQPYINGALVGGASLSVAKFLQIAASAAKTVS